MEKSHKLGIAAACAASLAVVLIIYLFAPTEHRFYPRCAFHWLTGLACPGCGSLRAVHSLLHGEVATAFRLNALLFTVVPAVVMSYGLRRFFGLAPARPVWIWLLLVIILAFSILRNLPMTPFNYLKP